MYRSPYLACSYGRQRAGRGAPLPLTGCAGTRIVGRPDHAGRGLGRDSGAKATHAPGVSTATCSSKARPAITVTVRHSVMSLKAAMCRYRLPRCGPRRRGGGPNFCGGGAKRILQENSQDWAQDWARDWRALALTQVHRKKNFTTKLPRTTLGTGLGKEEPLN